MEEACHWFDEDESVHPIVLFKSGESRTLSREMWDGQQGIGNKVSRSQYPIKLAWALTVHRAQGMTLDMVEIDIKGSFEYGQAYVALSRATSFAGLRIHGGWRQGDFSAS